MLKRLLLGLALSISFAPYCGAQTCNPVGAVSDPGYPEGRASVDFDGDGCADSCRVVGVKNNYRLWCTSANGANSGRTISSNIIDAGYPEGRQWLDINEDGKSDYCRVTGVHPKLRIECILSSGGEFGINLVSDFFDGGYTYKRYFERVNGWIRYCRIVGVGKNLWLRCIELIPSPSNGRLVFGSDVTIPNSNPPPEKTLPVGSWTKNCKFESWLDKYVFSYTCKTGNSNSGSNFDNKSCPIMMACTDSMWIICGQC